MKTLKIISFILVFVSICTTSCRKTDQKEDAIVETKPMTEINVDQDFNWETTRILEVSLTGASTGVVYIKPVEGDYYYFKGMLSAGSDFTTKITVPSYVREVKLMFKGTVYNVPVIGSRLDYNFN